MNEFPFEKPPKQSFAGFRPTGVAFQKDKNLLAISGRNRIDFWEGNGRFVISIPMTELAGQMAFSPSGESLLAIAGDSIYKIKINSFQISRISSNYKANCLCFAGEDRFFLGGDFGTIFELDIQGNFLSDKKFGESPILELAYANAHNFLFCRTDSEKIYLWKNKDTDSTPLFLKNFPEKIISFYFSTNKSILLTVDKIGGVSIWKIDSTKLTPFSLQESFSIGKNIRSASFCSQRSHIILGTADKQIEIYSPDGNRLFHSGIFEKDTLQIFYPHLGHLIIIGQEGDMVFWEDYHPKEKNLFKGRQNTFIPDTFTHGEDQMNHGSDLRAFAELIASCNLKPPLSIGIFANWGAGKSFFMRKLRDKIDSLSLWAREDMKYVQQKDLPYFKNIIQVEFNAWHYVESDLWASLVEEIFSNLQLPGERKDEAIDRRNKLLEILEAEKIGLVELEKKRQEIEKKEKLLGTFFSMKILNRFLAFKTKDDSIDEVFSSLENSLFDKIQKRSAIPYTESLEALTSFLKRISGEFKILELEKFIDELKNLHSNESERILSILGKIKNLLTHKLLNFSFPPPWRENKYAEELERIQRILHTLKYEISEKKLQMLGIEEVLTESLLLIGNKKMRAEFRYKEIVLKLKQILIFSIQKNFPSCSRLYIELETAIQTMDKAYFISEFSSLDEKLREDDVALPTDIRSQFFVLFDFDHPVYQSLEWTTIATEFLQVTRKYIEDYLFLSFGAKGLFDKLQISLSKSEAEILDVESFLQDTFLQKQKLKEESFGNWLIYHKDKFFQNIKENRFLYLGILSLLSISSFVLFQYVNSHEESLLSNIIRSILDNFILETTGILTALSPFLKYIYDKWRKFTPSVKKLWKILVDVSDNSHEEMKKWEISFHNEKKEIQKEEEKIYSKIEQLEQELKNLRSGKEDMLSNFIQNRTEDDTYRNQLGLMAKIRKDFERLSRYMNEFNQKQFLEQELDLDRLLSPYRVNRIVLYIDDLDRCPPERVVKVLQAVHLLLSFELFVVVVAVDSRWVIQCLRLGYKDLFVDKSIDLDRDGSTDITRATPHDYLEKIFQIPYWLNPIDDEAKQKLISNLIGESELDPIVNNKIILSEFLEPSLIENKVLEKEFIPKNVFQDLFQKFPGTEKLELGSREFLFIKKLTPILGSSPRAIKRYVNIFRLIRVSLEQDKWSVYYLKSPVEERRDVWNLENYKIVMFLQALITGSPNLSLIFFSELRSVASETKNLQTLFQRIRRIIFEKNISQTSIESDEEAISLIPSVLHRKKIQKEFQELEKWIQERKTIDRENWDELFINQLKFWDFAVSRYSFRIDPLQ